MSAHDSSPPPRQRAPAVVSLTTDFGLADPFVGLVKAQVLGRCPQASLVDLTHGITPHRIEEAAFWLERCRRHFPRGTLHLVVVDPGVGGPRDVLAVRLADQLFLGPDNGVLGGLAAAGGASVRKVSAATLGRLGLDAPSATFHARDVFAPLAGELTSGRLSFEMLGPTTTSWVPRPGSAPQAGARGVLGRVIVIDRFGNCISNIDDSSIAEHEIEEVRFGGHLLPLVRTYSDRPPGADVSLVNSFGVLEAARVQGRADEALGLGYDSQVAVTWRAAPPPARGA